jgi:hypothetical protein
LLKATISFVMSICPSVRLSFRPSNVMKELINSAPSGKIFIKFDIEVFFENMFHYNPTRIKVTSYEDILIVP